jgi:hypothetical protein
VVRVSSAGWTVLAVGLWLTLLLPSAMAQASTSDSAGVEHFFSRQYVSQSVRDLTHILAAPGRWDGRDWIKFGIFSGAVAGTVLLLDQPVRDFSQRNRSRLSNNLGRDFKPFGSYYPFIIESAFYLGGELSRDRRATACGLDAFTAGVISVGVIDQPLKALIGRKRPYQNAGKFSFDPFTFDASFPSGHTTHAFALATVVSMHYPRSWVRITSYGVASLVALDRINDDAHFMSDDLVGAVIGTVVGRAVVLFNRKLRKL